MSNFKLTLDEGKDEDYKIELYGLPFYYGHEVAKHLHNLVIKMNGKRLELHEQRNE